MVGGQSRAKLLTSYWLGSRESPGQDTALLYRKQIALVLLIFFLNLFFFKALCILCG